MSGRSAVAGRAGSVAGRVRRSAQRFGDALYAPLPRVQIDAGRTVPVWVPRLLLALLGTACLVMLAPGVLVIVVVSLLLATVVVRPGGAAAPIFCGVVGVLWLVLEVPDPLTFVLLAIASAIPALGAAVGNLGLQTRVQLRALRPALVRYGVLQLVTQPFVALALLLSRAELALLPVAIIATALIAVAVWTLLPRLR